MNTISIFLYLLLMMIPIFSAAIVEELQPGFRIDYISDNKGKNELRIYCYTGQPTHIINIWRTILLELDIKSDSYVQYDGSTFDEVHNKYLEHQSIWSIKLNPFYQSCVGIETNKKYSIYLRVIHVDCWKILLLLFGILLFIFAPKLSKNIIFYYFCIISFGICAVDVFMMTMFNYQAFWLYRRYYILPTKLAIIIVCYHLEAMTNQRSMHQFECALKLTSLVFIYLSSQFQEVSMGCIILLLLIYNCLQIWIVKSRTYCKKRFPLKVKLLSKDEYYQQDLQETFKALEELRHYCSSSECDQWKTVLRLKDAKRFASFVEGEFHLRNDEILQYWVWA